MHFYKLDAIPVAQPAVSSHGSKLKVTLSFIIHHLRERALLCLCQLPTPLCQYFFPVKAFFCRPPNIMLQHLSTISHSTWSCGFSFDLNNLLKLQLCVHRCFCCSVPVMFAGCFHTWHAATGQHIHDVYFGAS